MGPFGLIAVSSIITVLTTLYVYLWAEGNRFCHMIRDLPAKKYPLRCLYPFGMEVLSRVRFGSTSMYGRKMERSFRMLYGRKHSAFYRSIHAARMISVSWTVLILLLLLSVMIDAWAAVLFAFFGAGGMIYYYDRVVMERVNRNREQVRRDFPEALTAMTLLVNAGLVLDKAWRTAAQSGSGLLYDEMRRAVVRIDNGISRADAWREFAERCGDPHVDKVVSALLQNLSKGNRELVAFLKRMSDECWNDRKHAVRRKGETASARMLFPIMLTFLGILILVMAPIMSNSTI